MSTFDLNEFNRGLIDEFRANEGRVTGVFEGAPMVLVTHTGAKSGERRTTPLVHSVDDGSVVIIASMGGAPRNPAWFHNIVANPRVTVELGAETFEADAEILTRGPERDRLFAQQAALMPNFNDYQAKTERVIPVVVLRRV